LASKKKRKLCDIIVEKGMAAGTEQAKALINCGLVLLGDKTLTSDSVVTDENIEKIRIKHQKRFVSRGAVKLQAVFDNFPLEVTGAVCLDVGASTGGFTQLLLEKGALKVYALDVGVGILDHKLRGDPRVAVWEGINVRNLGEHKDKVEELAGNPADICVIDVSFISLSLIIPAVLPYVKNEGLVIPLVKPQFEAEKEEVGKGGIVRDEKVRYKVMEKIEKVLIEEGCEVLAKMEAGIKGAKGNIEYFFVARKK
jgi:23S rRNA (cytidine1920-2'-O)/16S rRNA (cytidine1409-2'-O)-methyltransferase